PIYQEIPNLSAAKSAYGNIVYRKAPSFLRQAEFYLGEDKFQTAVRAFLKKHEFANAEWTDLVTEFQNTSWLKDELGYKNSNATDKAKYEEASRNTIRLWADVWVKSRGLPIVRVGENGRTPGIIISQEDKLEQKKHSDLWTLNFNVLFKYKNGKGIIKHQFLDFEGEEVEFADLEIKEKPVFIFPNYQDYGYGIFLLDEKSRAYVLANIQNEKDDFLRTMMWGSLWDSVREAELPPLDYVALVIKNINVEPDESTIQTLLGRVSTAMNYYLSDAQSKELAAQIETLLIEKMQNAPTLGLRITFYRAFLNVASTEKAKQTLKEVLSGKFEIKDLKLKTKDKFDIITRLSILGDKDAPNLLAELEKSETSDEAKRYAYAAKAGIATTENKAKFYNDFTGNKELSESWIETAFVAFNSPKHAELTLPYLEKALAELPNLKKNRKIFFINGWLGAFIGGQKSEQALAIVNKFLVDNPNLDKDLRLKILENADGLERAVKIREKFNLTRQITPKD
ncbi:MAG: ERAP1-like C-terminal domain-containing protein, partial [Pyrinomonadaceae bacterium]